MRRQIAFLLATLMMLSAASVCFATGATFDIVPDIGNVNVASKPVAEQSEREISYEFFNGERPYYIEPAEGVQTRAGGSLYGFAAGTNGFHWAQIDIGNADTYTSLSATSSYVYAAVFCKEDGQTYAVWRDSAGNFKFGIAIVETGDFIEKATLSMPILAMSMDYSTNTCYAMSPETRTIYTVDFATGNFTPIGNIEGTDFSILLLMCVDTIGTMYVIDFYGILYSVDTTTLQATKIGDTGLPLNYTQGMTFDHDSQVLYWAQFSEFESGLYAIDTDTAKPTYVGSLNGAEVSALHTRPASTVVPEPTNVQGVELNITEHEMTVDFTFNLYANLLPQGAYFLDRSVVWSSSNENIATVSAGGTVLATGEGIVTITVATVDGEHMSSCVVTVIGHDVYYRELNDALNKVDYGTPDYCVFKTGQMFPFIASTVDGRQAGVSTNYGMFGTTSFIETSEPIALIGGTTLSFEWKISAGDYDFGQFFVNGKQLTYISGEKNWAKYTYTAPVTGIYSFHWQYAKNPMENVNSDCMWVDNIEITPAQSAPITGISIMPEESNLAVGTTSQLTPVYAPLNAEMRTVNYTSSNESVAIVSDTGLVTAISVGTATITLSTDDGQYSDVSSITVEEGPRALNHIPFKTITKNNTYSFDLGGKDSYLIIANQNLVYAYGFSITLNAQEAVRLVTAPGNINPASDPQIIVFNSDYEQLAYQSDTSITNYYNDLEFMAPINGTYYIVITTEYDYRYDSGSLTLTTSERASVPVVGVSVTPKSRQVGLGVSCQFTANINPANATNTAVVWEIADENVATIDENGLVRTVGLGTTTVKATTAEGFFTDTATLTVVEPVLPSYDGMIYGYCLSGDTDIRYNFIKYDPAGSAQDLTTVKYAGVQFFAAEYYNGLIYAYNYVNYGTYYVLEFVTLDANTFEALTSTPVNTTKIPVDMAFDYSTGTMYAAVDASTGTSQLARINLDTGDIVNASSFALGGAVMRSLACDEEGNLYGIASNSNYYGIDKEHAALTEICNVGYSIKPNFLQTMTYDSNTGLIYWFQFADNENGSSHVVTLTPKEGDILSEDILGNGVTQITGAFVYSSGYAQGDVNMDSKVNTGDAAAILQYCVSLRDFSANQMKLADYNNDNAVNTGDAAGILLSMIKS